MQDGRLGRDMIGQHHETLDGKALLHPVMGHGKRLEAGRVPLAESREHARLQLQALPPELRHLRRVHPGYRVDISAALQEMEDRLARRAAQTERGRLVNSVQSLDTAPPSGGVPGHRDLL